MKNTCAQVKLSTTNAKFSFLEDNKRLSETAGNIHKQRHILLLGGLKVLTSGAFSDRENSKLLHNTKLKIHKILSTPHSTPHFYFNFNDDCKLTKQCERVPNVSGCFICLQTTTTLTSLPEIRYLRLGRSRNLSFVKYLNESPSIDSILLRAKTKTSSLFNPAKCFP